MSWTPRQLAMLREMGITLWQAPTKQTAPAATSIPLKQPPTSVPQEASELPVATPSTAQAASQAPQLLDTHSSPPSSASLLEAVSGTPLAHVASLDWDDLRQAVATCQACQLCTSRRQTVFGVGNPQAHWMIIGEAPGEQEDRQGEPFVGKAGQLLDRMLEAIGLTRAPAEPAQQVFIANVLKCRPPGNRNPQPDEVAQCEPFLKRQVALVQPRLILAMGRFAVQSILQTQEPIGRLRGRLHRYAGVPVVVTYHPAYLLRNPIDKARAWEDLCLAREAMQHS